jgi:DNA-binding NarL/FixJ family response regulator
MLAPAVVVFNITAMDLNAIAAISIMNFLSPATAIVAMCSSDDAMQLSISGNVGVTCFVRRTIDARQLRQIMCSLAGWMPAEPQMRGRRANSRPIDIHYDSGDEGDQIPAWKIGARWG